MLTLTWTDSAGVAQTLAFDAEVTEQFSGEMDITDHPMERGANATDHARKKPSSLQVEGLLTDALREVFASGSIVTRARPGRALASFRQLEEIRDQALVCTIKTAARTHENMLLQSLSWTRDRSSVTVGPGLIAQDTGKNYDGTGALRIKGTFREVRFVDSQTVAITKTKVTKAKGKVEGGKQTTSPASKAEENKSLLKKLVGGITDALQKPGVQ